MINFYFIIGLVIGIACLIITIYIIVNKQIKDLMSIDEHFDIHQGYDEIRFLYEHNNGYGNHYPTPRKNESDNPTLDESYRKWYEEDQKIRNSSNVISISTKRKI